MTPCRIRPELVPEHMRSIAVMIRALSHALDEVYAAGPEAAAAINSIRGLDVIGSELAAQVDAVASEWRRGYRDTVAIVGDQGEGRAVSKLAAE